MAATATELYTSTFDGADLERIELPEIDDDLLMELLEEGSSAGTGEPEEDRLGFVMRSLEAEITTGGEPTGAEHDGGHCHGCGGLDDILSDLDGHDCSPTCVPTAAAAEDWVLGWSEMVVGPESPAGGGMEGWYVDGDRFGGVYGYNYGESVAMEPVYGSLWE